MNETQNTTRPATSGLSAMLSNIWWIAGVGAFFLARVHVGRTDWFQSLPVAVSSLGAVLAAVIVVAVLGATNPWSRRD